MGGQVVVEKRGSLTNRPRWVGVGVSGGLEHSTLTTESGRERQLLFVLPHPSSGADPGPAISGAGTTSSTSKEVSVTMNSLRARIVAVVGGLAALLLAGGAGLFHG
jgi:hypothetical protein